MASMVELEDSDDEIMVVEEKLTPTARLKAKTRMNLLRSGFAGIQKKIVKVGPGGIIRTADGKIISKLTKRPLANVTKMTAGMRPTASTSSSFKMGDSDDDDDLTCRICLSSYWYKNEVLEHLKSTHSIEDPEKYLREKQWRKK